MSGSEEPGRDPHLQAALRHAPDGEAGVPPLLRARIVAAAQRSADASRRRRPWWRRLDAGWSPWRMGGAGTAAAAVLAATVLWVGRDEQPAAPELRRTPQGPVTGQSSAERRPPASDLELMASGAPGSRTVSPGSPPITSGAGDTSARSSAEPAPARPSATSPPDPNRKAEAGRDTAAARRAAANDAAAQAGTAAAASERAAAQERRSAQELRRSAPLLPEQAAVAAAAPATAQAPAPAPAVAPAPERPTPFADALPPPPARTAPPSRSTPPAAEAAAPTRQDQRADGIAALRMRQGATGGGVPERASAPAVAPAASPAPSPAPSPAAGPAAAPPDAPSPAAPATPAPAMPSARPSAAQGAVAPAGAARSAELGGSAMLSASRQALVEAWLTVPDAASWRGRAPSGVEAPLAAGWLADLAAATRGRWIVAPSGPTSSTEAAAPTDVWTLVHPSGKRASLTWVAGGVVVCDLQASRCEQTRIEQATMEMLRQRLRR